MALIVGTFPELKHAQFTWFGNLPTPRSYWFVLIKVTNNTNNKTRRRRNSSLLNSTLPSSLSVFLSMFLLVFLSQLQLSLLLLQFSRYNTSIFFSSHRTLNTHTQHIYIYNCGRQRGVLHHVPSGRLGNPTCTWWGLLVST